MTSIDEVIDEMSRRWRALDRAGDMRAVFAKSYLATTEAVRRAAEKSGGFEDPAWLVALDVEFARRYFAAFDAFESGAPCPRPWLLALENASARKTFVLQDILLGMNAHIAYDLPHALDATIPHGCTPERLEVYRRDHEHMNRVLAETVDHVQRQAAWAYDPALMLGDVLLGNLDERLAATYIGNWRTRVWEQFLLLRSAHDAPTRALVESHIDNAATDGALWLLEPQKLLPALVPPLRAWRGGVSLVRRGLERRRRLRARPAGKSLKIALGGGWRGIDIHLQSHRPPAVRMQAGGCWRRGRVSDRGAWWTSAT